MINFTHQTKIVGVLGALNPFFIFFILMSISIDGVWADVYSAQVKFIGIEQIKTLSEKVDYALDADVEYRLSPIAKEALHKGISLTWWIIIKVQQQGLFWDSTKRKLEIGYQIQNHELLNLYSVKNINRGTTDMFSTLKAALNSISKVRKLPLINQQPLQKDERYHVAIKVLFDREALPVPLRPMSYFNSEWALSSSWTLWPLQN